MLADHDELDEAQVLTQPSDQRRQAPERWSPSTAVVAGLVVDTDEGSAPGAYDGSAALSLEHPAMLADERCQDHVSTRGSDARHIRRRREGGRVDATGGGVAPSSAEVVMRALVAAVLAVLVLATAACYGPQPATAARRGGVGRAYGRCAGICVGWRDVGRQARRLVDAAMYAARRGHLDVMRALLEPAPILNRVDGRNRWTPLMHALHTKNRAAALLLLERGADPGGRERQRLRPARHGRARQRHRDDFRHRGQRSAVEPDVARAGDCRLRRHAGGHRSTAARIVLHRVGVAAADRPTRDCRCRAARARSRRSGGRG